MKKFIPLFVVALLATFIVACESNNSTDESKDDTTTQKKPKERNKYLVGMSRIDFGERGIPLSLVLPDTMNNNFQLNITDWGETEVRCGKYFQLGIAEGGDLALRKTDLAEDLLYKVEYIQEIDGKPLVDGAIIYKQFVEGDESINPAYHFYMIKEIGGVQYEIQDLKTGEAFPEKAILRMYEAAKEFKATEIITP